MHFKSQFTRFFAQTSIRNITWYKNGIRPLFPILDPELTKCQPAKRKDTSAPAAGPRSKLAKEHNITAAEETEIKEAFSLFSQKMEGEKEGVIAIGDVRRALMYVQFGLRSPEHSFIDPHDFAKIQVYSEKVYTDQKNRALGLTPTASELREYHSILDPEDEGYTVYRHFLAICAIKFHSRTRTSDSHKKDVDDAFRLFTSAGQKKNGGAGGEDMGKITLATLKRVAMLLKEDVDEDLLVSMLLEANGGKGVGKGVERDEFEGVMRRAGMWR